MGVPGFMGWLLKFYKSKILLKQLDQKCDHFYIDANCAFHPECAKINEHFAGVQIDDLEDKMFRRIKNYLTYLYNYVDAEQTNGTAIDGPAPLAKMSQQRKRRFKSIDDTIVRNNIKRKHGKAVNDSWNNTVITPGTVFMERLHLELLEFFKNMKSKTRHVYSSYHTPGEGEHSILQHIKANVKKDDIVVIYGLDADLIFLAMTSGIENIYLLREAIHFGIKKEENDLYDPIEDVAEELIYVSIKAVKESFNQQIRHLVDRRNDLTINFAESVDFSNDLVVICFLLGNDFLPHFPSIDIHKGGLDTIIDAYIETLAETNVLLTEIIDEKLIINNVFFEILTEKLGKKEERFFRESVPYYEFLSNKRKCMAFDEYSKELWNLENLKIFKIKDPVKLGNGSPDEWKFRYYEHYFGVVEHQQEFIDELVKLYLEGVVWVGRYYFESCPDWRWHYPYDHAPFISDIANYLKSHPININNITFTKGEPIEPMTQLLTVLPPASSGLLAQSYRSLVLSDTSPIIDMFPCKTELEMLHKNQYWQCIPKLPVMDIDRIISATKDKMLTKEEKIRNVICGDFIFEKLSEKRNNFSK